MAQAKKKQTRKKNLVIVESPSKAKTIGKFLGSNYKVIASVGHVRDLPKSTMGIDIENDFEPRYINIRGKGDVIKSLKKEAKAAGKIYLATDPDREGEAISWHLAYLLGIDPEEPCRIVFNEITKTAVKNAVKNPRKIDMGLVDAQQARRVLDRVVGYSISPLLWRKVRRGLSAGRVQSAALKLICDRENEILEFNPVEYWNIFADLKGEKNFESKLTLYKGKKIENGTIGTKAESDSIIKEVKSEEFTVAKVEEKTRSRKPQAPYTTSSLQQDAANRVNFNTRKTMQIAQQLYEGVEVKGHGTIGLVSYIRTDSTRISEEARAAAKEYITEKYGADYYGGIIYVNKNKDAQDAHEAIRPTFVSYTPDSVKEYLTRDQLRLYSIIWERFVSSQMNNAKSRTTSLELKAGEAVFRISATKIVDKGFYHVIKTLISKEERDSNLPVMKIGEEIQVEKFHPEQHFTQPPARYTEDTLLSAMKNAGRFVEDEQETSILKEVEGLGTGRTRPAIIENIKHRGYFEVKKKQILPTQKCMDLFAVLPETTLSSPSLTAQFEEMIQDVEDGKMTHAEYMKRIDEDVLSIIDTIKKDNSGKVIGMQDTKHTNEDIGVCPICGKPIRENSKAYGCTGYKDGCSFVIWKEIAGNKITSSQAKALLEKGITSKIKGFKSKSGKSFDAYLKLEDGKVAFSFEAPSTNPPKAFGDCPSCGHSMSEDDNKFYCENCDTKLYKNALAKLGKKRITKAEAKKLLDGERIDVDLVSKAGKPYTAKAYYDHTTGWVKISFD